MLRLTEREQEFVFENVEARPVPSLLRGFSGGCRRCMLHAELCGRVKPGAPQACCLGARMAAADGISAARSFCCGRSALQAALGWTALVVPCPLALCSCGPSYAHVLAPSSALCECSPRAPDCGWTDG